MFITKQNVPDMELYLIEGKSSNALKWQALPSLTAASKPFSPSSTTNPIPVKNQYVCFNSRIPTERSSIIIKSMCKANKWVWNYLTTKHATIIEENWEHRCFFEIEVRYKKRSCAKQMAWSVFATVGQFFFSIHQVSKPKQRKTRSIW